MANRKFSIKNQLGEKLVCIEVLPQENQTSSMPAVILCHGFAYYKEEDGIFTEIAKRLAGLGYAAYYFDFSGCGESEGDYSLTTLTKLVEDLRSVYETVTGYSYIDSDRVSLVGQSFGTSVAVCSRIQNLERIVLCGSFYSPYELFRSYFQEVDEAGVSRRTHSDGSITVMGSQFWSDLKQYDLPEIILGYDCPILFVHGKLDSTVPMELMTPLLKAAKHPVGPVILEKSDHGLEPEREQVFQAVADFFTAKP